MLRAYEASRLYRDVKLRGPMVDEDGQLLLLRREQLESRVQGVWNLTSEHGNLGTFHITNVIMPQQADDGGELVAMLRAISASCLIRVALTPTSAPAAGARRVAQQAQSRVQRQCAVSAGKRGSLVCCIPHMCMRWCCCCPMESVSDGMPAAQGAASAQHAILRRGTLDSTDRRGCKSVPHPAPFCWPGQGNAPEGEQIWHCSRSGDHSASGWLCPWFQD